MLRQHLFSKKGWDHVNIATNLEKAAFYFPDRPAIIDGESAFSFDEFNREANRIAGA